MPEISQTNTQVAEEVKSTNNYQDHIRQNLNSAKQAEHVLEQEVFALPPTELAGLKDENVRTKADRIVSNFRQDFREEGKILFSNYLATEAAINSYINPLGSGTHTAAESAAAMENAKKEFFNNLFAARHFSPEETIRYTAELDSIQVNRNIHGTLAFDNISASLFQRLAVHTLSTNQGTIQDDSPENIEAIASFIHTLPAGAGFIDHSAELLPNSVPSGLENADIAFIYGNSPEVIQSLETYERNKVLEKYKRILFKQVVPSNSRERFMSRFGADARTQHALISEANLLLSGESIDYLVRHGITPEYIRENDSQAENGKLFTLVTREIKRQIDEIWNNNKISDEQRYQQMRMLREHLADDILSAVSMKQLLGAWTGLEEKQIREQTEVLRLSDEDFYGEGKNGKGLLPAPDLKEGYYAIPGQTLKDHEKIPTTDFTIKRWLGNGQYGIVYLAEDSHGQLFVVKEAILNPSDPTSEKALKVEREALEICTRMHVPRVPTLEAFLENIPGKALNVRYIVENYVEGQQLLRLLCNEIKDPQGDYFEPKIPFPWSVEDTLEANIKLFETYHYLHNYASIVIKDIKPENIQIAVDGNPWVLDPGGAHILTKSLIPGYQQMKLGTVGYAPYSLPVYDQTGTIIVKPGNFEQAHATPASDIHAATGVLYFTLTGEDPDGPFMTPNMKSKLNEIKDRLEQQHSPLFTDFEDVIIKIITLGRDENPGERPIAQAIHNALFTYLHPNTPIPTLNNPNIAPNQPQNVNKQPLAIHTLDQVLQGKIFTAPNGTSWADWEHFDPSIDRTAMPDCFIQPEQQYGRLKISYGSDRGEVRLTNPDEDTVYVGDILVNGAPSDEIIMILSDGMGGHANGKQASESVVNSVRLQYALNKAHGMTSDQALENAVLFANDKLCDENDASPFIGNRPGATCIVSIIDKVTGRVTLANVGDSRGYKISDTQARRSTIDHSIVESLVQSGIITNKDRYTHPMRNRLTRSMGEIKGIPVDIYHEQLADGEQIFMCCDGLWEMTRDDSTDDAEVIRQLARFDRNQGRVVKAGIALANYAGGEDNISIVAARYDSSINVTPLQSPPAKAAPIPQPLDAGLITQITNHMKSQDTLHGLISTTKDLPTLTQSDLQRLKNEAIKNPQVTDDALRFLDTMYNQPYKDKEFQAALQLSVINTESDVIILDLANKNLAPILTTTVIPRFQQWAEHLGNITGYVNEHGYSTSVELDEATDAFFNTLRNIASTNPANTENAIQILAGVFNGKQMPNNYANRLQERNATCIRDITRDALANGQVCKPEWLTTLSDAIRGNLYAMIQTESDFPEELTFLFNQIKLVSQAGAKTEMETLLDTIIAQTPPMKDPDLQNIAPTVAARIKAEL